MLLDIATEELSHLEVAGSIGRSRTPTTTGPNASIADNEARNLAPLPGDVEFATVFWLIPWRLARVLRLS
jgi:Mn-containing catalase